MPKKGRITLVDMDAFESKPLTLDEAVHALKSANTEVWVVVRSLKGSKKDQAGRG